MQLHLQDRYALMLRGTDQTCSPVLIGRALHRFWASRDRGDSLPSHDNSHHRSYLACLTTVKKWQNISPSPCCLLSSRCKYGVKRSRTVGLLQRLQTDPQTCKAATPSPSAGNQVFRKVSQHTVLHAMLLDWIFGSQASVVRTTSSRLQVS